ncbi:reverse transcriptase domain, reverse transcriptase zinc-binding domain protein [Tanacetum coccineum]
MVDGCWCEEPNVIKQEMVRYYKTLFTERSRIRPRFYCDRVVKISDEDASMLEGEIGEKEVADPISLGDFRHISLIGYYYKILAKILAEREKKVIGEVMNKCKPNGIGVKWCNLVPNWPKSASTSNLGKWSPGRVYFKRGALRPRERPSVSSIFYSSSRRQGLPISDRMSCIKAWRPVVEKFKNRLADWKARSMSLREALLGEYWWRFKREGDTLWVRVIKSVYGENRGLSNSGEAGCGCGGSGAWRDIIKLGNGRDVSFWLDRWIEDFRLCDRFPRLFNLDRRPEGRVAEKGRWVEGVWTWECEWFREPRGRFTEDGGFAVKELTRLVEERTLDVENVGEDTSWLNLVPKKVNIFMWRALKMRLPVHEELDKKGIDLDMVLCPCCDSVVESCEHSLVMCSMAMGVWEKVHSWWKLGGVNAFSIRDIFLLNGGVNLTIVMASGSLVFRVLHKERKKQLLV